MGGGQAAYGAWCQVVLGPWSISFSLRGPLVATTEGGIMAWGCGIGVLAGSREKNASWCVHLRNLILVCGNGCQVLEVPILQRRKLPSGEIGLHGG